MLSLRYSLTAEDFANYSVYVQIDAPGKNKSRLKRQLPVFIIIAVIFGINILNAASSGRFDIISLVPMLVIFGIFLLSTSSFSLKQRVRKAALAFTADPMNNVFFQMTDYTFSETGVTNKDEVKETRLKWNAFVKKQETAEYIFLFVTSTSAYIIPKRVFRSEVQKEELDKLFGQYLSFDAEVGHLVKD